MDNVGIGQYCRFTLISVANMFVFIDVKIYFKMASGKGRVKFCIPFSCTFKELVYSNTKAYFTPSEIVC